MRGKVRTSVQILVVFLDLLNMYVSTRKKNMIDALGIAIASLDSINYDSKVAVD